MHSLAQILYRKINEDYGAALKLIKFKCFEDTNIIIVDYILQEQERVVEPVRYDIDQDEFISFPGMRQTFTRKQAQIANWYFDYLSNMFMQYMGSNDDDMR